MTYYSSAVGAKVFAAGSLNFSGSALNPMTTILLENLWRRLAKPRPTAGSGPIASEPDPEPDFQDNVLARLGLLEATQRIADRLRAFWEALGDMSEDDGSQLPPTSVQIRAAGTLLEDGRLAKASAQQRSNGLNPRR